MTIHPHENYRWMQNSSRFGFCKWGSAILNFNNILCDWLTDILNIRVIVPQNSCNSGLKLNIKNFSKIKSDFHPSDVDIKPLYLKASISRRFALAHQWNCLNVRVKRPDLIWCTFYSKLLRSSIFSNRRICSIPHSPIHNECQTQSA